MNTYLQISGLFFVLLIAFLFFPKNKVNSIENKTYGTILIYTILVIIADICMRFYAIYYPLTPLADYLYKADICLLVGYPIIFTYYIFCITSLKRVDMVDIKEHPNKKYFDIVTIVMFLLMIITWVIIMLLDITLSSENGIFTQSGPAMKAQYIVGIICIVLWIIMFIKYKITKGAKNKGLLPIFIYTLVSIAAAVMQHLYPEYNFISVSLALMTVIIYNTIETPDVYLLKQLNQAKQEAEEANKQKTDFLSSMSHEIRTPLNAIVGFGQALAKEDISDSAKEEVRDILMASNTLMEIVNGILDISKIESNKIEIINVEYSSKKLVDEITSLINARIGSKPIELTVLIDEKLPPVLFGDAMRIKQIIINLLTNSVKYTKEGRILFQIKAENENDKSNLTITVQDTGMGMTDEAVEQLFIKYQRFDGEKNANVEGSGLGLAITKGLVEMMGGDIKVKSTYGEGSTFTITLQQQIVANPTTVVEKEETETTVTPFNATGQTILVVDDNKINLKVAERLLREYKATIETVFSGSECIDRVLDGKKYDLIFMDIMMPKMDGMETLENLRNIAGFNMPVVALTADVISGMEEKYINKGFDDCLAKPIVEEELYYMLKKFLKENTEEVQEVKNEDLETSEAHNVELLEKNRINVAAGLELLKDMEMYEMTLEEFYNELQNKITDLTKFKEEGNMDDYAILAHALKSEARYVGCNELGDLAYEHELAGKDKNQELVNQKFDELKNETNRIYDVLKKYFGE